MKLYKEVLIESAEQAAALPIGTVAILGPHEDGPMSFLRSDGNAPPWYASTDGDSHTSNGEMVGCIALVPIEAEEETRHCIIRDSKPTGKQPETRLVTPWEEA